MLNTKKKKNKSFVMKFFLIACILLIHFPVFSQNQSVKIKGKDITIKSAFEQIEKQTGLTIAYDESVLNVNQRIKGEIKAVKVKDALSEILKGTKSEFIFQNKHIIVRSIRTKSDQLNDPAKNQSTDNKTKYITGIISDEHGETLPGVAVQIEGTSKGVLTAPDGTFSLEAKSSDKLVVSYIGMYTQTVPIGNQEHFDIKMDAKGNELRDVTVVAYGTQRKESVIGAISTIALKDLDLPGGNISNTLAGQMAGIVSVKSSGEPGVGSNFWIRGISTFGANSSPLILVDGVERPLDLVDYDDIESFSILKDATATAVYGVRGANGIVLITTKRGKEALKPQISIKAEYGLLSPMNLPKLADAGQWIDYYNDINFDKSFQNVFTDSEKAMYLDGTDPDLYPNVDWINTIFKQITTSQKATMNVTGGSKAIKYYVSGSFYTENGVFNPAKNLSYDPSMRYNKYSFRSNIDANLTSSTQLALNLSNQFETKNRLGDINHLWYTIISTPPIAAPTIYSDGTLPTLPPNGGATPYYLLNYTGYSKDFTNTSQALIGITQDFSDIITKGLKANIKFSWDAVNASTVSYSKQPTNKYAVGRDGEGNLIFVQPKPDGTNYLSLGRSNWGNRTINFESSITYDNIFNDVHRVGGLILFSMREHTNSFPGDYIAAFPFRNIGFAGRATYSFKDTYFLEGNFGYNGSENFAPAHRFGFFPSIALGYLMSNEDYFKNLLPSIHLLKIKGSYGMIGNDKIGGDRRFAYNSEMSNYGGYHFGSTGQQWRQGIATGYPGNPNVAWESSKKFNVGIELGLFQVLKIQADYFFDRREGIYILQESVPSVVGSNVPLYVNLGKMQNQGVDASLEYSQQFGEFSISSRVNFTFARNKKLYDDRPTPIWAYQELVNKPYGQHYGLIALGLFESEADIANSPKQTFDDAVVPGDIKYKDINGDGIINNYDEVAIGYTSIPEVNYGFGTSIGYKGIDLSLFFQGVGNISRMIGGMSIFGPNGSILTDGQIFADVADKRWKLSNPNPNAEYPRLSVNTRPNNRQPSTFWLRDMSFIRLKNVELGYTMPKKHIKHLGISSMRIFLQGVNLFTFSNFSLWDPELATSDGRMYPQMKTVNAGININF